jgi:hypothetical protein
MIYGVYYYKQTQNVANVILAGLYKTLPEAKDRLGEFVPNFKRHNKNSVISESTNTVGWVSVYEFGDINYTGLTCNQPHNSVDLF